MSRRHVVSASMALSWFVEAVVLTEVSDSVRSWVFSPVGIVTAQEVPSGCGPA